MQQRINEVIDDVALSKYNKLNALSMQWKSKLKKQVGMTGASC